MSGYPFSGPRAPEANPTIEPEWFQPSIFPITAIALGPATTVTTGTAFGVSNNFVVGQLVRFVIPFFYGCRQLNEQQGYVIGLPMANQVTIAIDTSLNVDPFIPSPPYSTTRPTLAAIGDVNTGGINASGRASSATTIEGSFINISPAAGG